MSFFRFGTDADAGIVPTITNFVAALLGYTPVNKAGDTISGPVTISGGSALNMGDGGGALKRIYCSANVLGINNNANSVQIFTLDDAGNGVFAGNATAASDERFKTNWKPLQKNFVPALAQVRYGSYDRVDIPGRFVGVGAQSLREVLPEAILEDSRGFLSVNYGAAALVACIELAKEVEHLKARLLAAGL